MAYRKTYRRYRKRVRRTRRGGAFRNTRTYPNIVSRMTYRPNQLSLVRRYDHFTLGGIDATPKTFGTMFFNLGQCPGASELTALFDRYKINGAAIRFILKTNPDIASTTYKGQNVRIFHAFDGTGGNAPTTEDAMRQYSGLRETNLSSDRSVGRWHFVKPKALIANTFSILKWIPCSVSNQAHYGIQYMVDNLFAGVYVIAECKLYLQLKNVV